MRPQAASALPETLKVKVLRAFYFNGEPIPVSTELKLPRLFAREMVAAGKAEIMEPAAAPKAEPKSDSKPESRADDSKPSARADGGKSARLV